jgi:sec-independent protein translocase protein TatA
MGIFGNTFGWPHLIVILVIVLIIFGGAKLPGLARGLGQSVKVFKNEIKPEDADKKPEDGSATMNSTEVPVVPVETTPADQAKPKS